ncbi:MAG: D-alanyl-D-alanine carboxypeptidase/D-alanyl-D-alanine-endopeptidase [Actinobacteria bacterium]|nr:D-alanyl-D-alanine carboxypeptidase/D-alanyl-D-alanine-endopeptidase [Actinomycetota bacterium]
MTTGTSKRGAVLAVLTALTLGSGVTAAVTLDSGPPPVTAAPEPSPTGPPVRSALLPAPAATSPVPTAAGLGTAVGAVLTDPALAGRLSVSIVDASTGEPLLERTARTPVIPASTAKIATAVAALTALPADQRLTTQVVAGAVPGEVVLVGGGDPTLAGAAAQPESPELARLPELAAQVRSAMGATVVTRVLVDESLYSGERIGPGWKPGYLTEGSVAAVGPLMVDGGRVRPGMSRRHGDPALAAGKDLATLVSPGAAVTVERGVAPLGAAQLGAVTSPPVPQLVERMLSRSDNNLAEALARQVAIARGQPASFAGAAVALGQVLAEVGVDGVSLADGSGLSRLNQIQPAALSRLLARAASGTEPRLAPVLSGLPVGGFDGTLADRYRVGKGAGPGAGAVRAKTGTLEGVIALAGLVQTADGRLLAFDLTADGVPPGALGGAEKALDRLAGSLAACGCR